MSEFGQKDFGSSFYGVVHQGYKLLFGLTKTEQKELEMKLSFLEAEVARLSYGNEVLQGVIPAIVQAILDYARTQGERIRIEGDTVYYINGNTGDVHLTAATQLGKSSGHTSSGLKRVNEIAQAGGLTPIR